MSLESKHFVASPTDVEEITKAVLDAQLTGTGGRADYLKALIATTQHALGSPPKQRNAPSSKIVAETRVRHLLALEETHKIFYGSVDKAAREILGLGRNAKELNRRTNFARSAMSTVRAWIRVGNDITGLAAARVTKSSLAVIAKKQKVTSPKVLTNRVRKYQNRFLQNVIKLSETDKDAARETLETIMAKLQATLDTMRTDTVHRRRSDRGLHAAA